ncbi:MAG: hypothetical protein HC880_12400 [Bacteroidia bacterium]|nr:hypothetical protein [Bacteroidia bacterium]
MKFLYPQFLWALSTLIIPIAIHLFNFRRVKRVYFSNVRLLKEVKTETNAFRRLKHLLVLLSRLGFISFLVLAFAQPYLPSENQKSIQNLSGVVSIYLDNSYSMQSELGNDTYLGTASRYINELVSVFPEDARFQLITNNFENKEQFPVASGEIEDRLTELDHSSAYRNLNALHQRQSSLLQRYAGSQRNQVFWFSDFQKSTTGDISQIELDTTNRYYIVPVKSGSTPNVMVDSVWLENPFIKALETNQVKVRLRSYSQEDYSDLVLKLFIDERQSSTTLVDLPPQGTAVAEFNFTVQGEGVKPCRISFEDFPVTFDNDYYFVLDASPNVRILHLYDQIENNYVQRVYENESVFNVNSFSVNNLDYNRIQNAELVILNEVKEVEGELANQLRAFVSQGGNLVVFPAVNPGESFRDFLGSLRVGGVQQQQADSLEGGRSDELAVLNVQNPFYQGIFESVPNNMNMPNARATLRWNNVGDNLLSFKNRQPYLSRFNFQQGNVYLFASPLQPNYSNFAKHAIFVPIMYKLASSSKSAGERLAYSFQEKTLQVRVNEPAKNEVYKLVKDALELVPAQRVIEDRLILELPEQILEAGYYKLMIGDRQESLLAFNYDKAESAMNFYSQQEIQNAFAKNKNVQIFDFARNKNFIQDFESRNIQVNLWKYMLIAALGFLLIEVVLIRLL